MPTQAPKIDKSSAFNFVRALESRIGDRLQDKLAAMFEENEDISTKEIQECVLEVLRSAAEASESETSLPDSDTLSASFEDIRKGRFSDVQDVIDELSSKNN